MTKLEDIASKLARRVDGLEIRNQQILFAKSHPEQIQKLAATVLKKAPQCDSFERTILGLMPLADWDLLVSTAVKLYHNSSLAEVIVRLAALQKPDSLHPYLKRFKTTGDTSQHIPMQAWRGASVLERNRLFRQFDSREIADRNFAISRLIETRDKPTITEAIKRAAAQNIYTEAEQELIQGSLSYAGLELDGDSLRQLYSDDALHIAFPNDYFLTRIPPSENLDRTFHPTWKLQDRSMVRPDAQLGGVIEDQCKICGSSLYRLLELTDRSILPDFYAKCPYTFVTCLNCLGKTGIYEFFFAHKPDGRIEHIYDGEPITPQMIEAPIVFTGANLINNGPRWALQDAWLSNYWENLFRVGGEPTWIQFPEYLNCPRCSKTMNFAAQIDSYLPLTDHTEWMWGDSGMCYLHFCPECSITASAYQSF